MSNFSSQTPPQENGVEAVHYQQLGSLVWSFVIGVIFFLITWQQNLHWTPWAVIVMGAVALFVTHRNRLSSGLQPVKVAIIYFFASALCLFLEGQSLISVPLPLPSPDPPIADIATEDLPGIYTGFRTQESGQLSHIVFTIEEILPEPSRLICKYSLNEGLRLNRGQALLYTTTKTLVLRDGTRFLYKRENGKIILWSITGSRLRLTRSVSP